MIHSNPRARLRPGHRRGSAVLETALAISVLLILTFGAIEFSYYFYVKNMFSDAARQGARAGAPPSSTNAAVQSAVASVLTSTNWSSSTYTVTITNTSGGAIDVATLPAGVPIQVTVTATWGTIGAGFRPLGLIGSSKQVIGVAVFRKEG